MQTRREGRGRGQHEGMRLAAVPPAGLFISAESNCAARPLDSDECHALDSTQR